MHVTVTRCFLIKNPLDHVFSINSDFPFRRNVEFFFGYLNSDFHLMSVLINDCDLEVSDDGFLFFNLGIRSASESINSDLDMEIDFNPQIRESIVTIGSDNKDLLIIEACKSSDFSFHECSKFSNSGCKCSLRIFLASSDFDDQFVLYI